MPNRADHTSDQQSWRQLFEADIPNTGVTPQQALSLLMEGNRRFVEGAPHAQTSMERRGTFAAGQSPIAAVLCCADSRVAPEILLDQPLGEIFSVRVAGNFLHDDGLASLEYAALKLGTPLIFVLGHTDCGAIKAAMGTLQEQVPLPGKLPALVGSIMPAVHHALAKNSGDAQSALDACIRTNVRFAVRDIAHAQPVLAPMAASGRLLVVGGVIRVETGRIELLETVG